MPPPGSDGAARWAERGGPRRPRTDRKSTRLNSSHGYISYAVFCWKKKKKQIKTTKRYSSHDVLCFKKIIHTQRTHHWHVVACVFGQKASSKCVIRVVTHIQ